MSNRILPILLLATLILAACAGAAPSPSGGVSPLDPAAPAGIEGSWKALTVAGQPVVPGHEPTATFAATEVDGTTGCNSYGGGYTYAAGAITFGPMRMTLMACIGPIGEVEGRFTAAMTGATTATVDPQGRLTIDGTAGSIVFVGVLT
jgi:heat shock protein HslJ